MEFVCFLAFLLILEEGNGSSEVLLNTNSLLQTNNSETIIVLNLKPSELRSLQTPEIDKPGIQNEDSTPVPIISTTPGPSLILTSYFNKSKPTTKGKLKGNLTPNKTESKNSKEFPAEKKDASAPGNVTNSEPSRMSPNEDHPIYKGNGIPFADARRHYFVPKMSDDGSESYRSSGKSYYPLNQLIDESLKYNGKNPASVHRRKWYLPLRIPSESQQKFTLLKNKYQTRSSDYPEYVNEDYEKNEELDYFDYGVPVREELDPIQEFRTKPNIRFEPAQDHPDYSYWTRMHGRPNSNSQMEIIRQYYDDDDEGPEGYNIGNKRENHFPPPWYSDSPLPPHHQPRPFDLDEVYYGRDPFISMGSGGGRVHNLPPRDKNPIHPMIHSAENVVVINKGQGRQYSTNQIKPPDLMDQIYLEYLKKKLRASESISATSRNEVAITTSLSRKPTMRMKVHVYPDENNDEIIRRKNYNNLYGSNYKWNNGVGKYNGPRNNVGYVQQAREYSHPIRSTLPRWGSKNSVKIWAKKNPQPKDNDVVLHLHLHNNRKHDMPMME